MLCLIFQKNLKVQPPNVEICIMLCSLEELHTLRLLYVLKLEMDSCAAKKYWNEIIAL